MLVDPCEESSLAADDKPLPQVGRKRHIHHIGLPRQAVRENDRLYAGIAYDPVIQACAVLVM